MSVVFAAQHVVLRQRVAIKLLSIRSAGARARHPEMPAAHVADHSPKDRRLFYLRGKRQQGAIANEVLAKGRQALTRVAAGDGASAVDSSCVTWTGDATKVR